MSALTTSLPLPATTTYPSPNHLGKDRLFMSEIEAPIEQTQEDVHHAAEHSRERWVGWVAVSSALLAALAAVTILLAGTYEHHSMEHLLEANDRWLQFQAKSIKEQEVHTRVVVYRLTTKPLTEEDHKSLEEDREKIKDYKNEKAELEQEAKALTFNAEDYSHRHNTLAKGVTMFQVAIAVAAIAVLSRRPPLWYVGLGLGVVGTVFLVLGFI
jgi:hypothetical protein